MDVIKDRHSVRQYSDKKIEKEKRDALMTAVAQCNAESELHIQILFDEPKCFSGMQGWMKDDRVMICCCSDGTRPVIFKVERIDY